MLGTDSILIVIFVNFSNVETWCLILCRVPALAEATYRDHYPSSCVVVGVIKNSVTFFSGTTEASFLIFGTEHQYGDLYRVTHF